MANIKVSVSEVMEVRGGPITESETWGILMRSVVELQRLIVTEKLTKDGAVDIFITPDSMLLCHDGQIRFDEVSSSYKRFHTKQFIPPEFSKEIIFTRREIEKMYIFGLGETLYTASQYRAPKTEIVNSSNELSTLLTLMRHSDADQRASLSDVLQVCMLSSHDRVSKVLPDSHFVIKLYRLVLGSDQDLPRLHFLDDKEYKVDNDRNDKDSSPRNNREPKVSKAGKRISEMQPKSKSLNYEINNGTFDERPLTIGRDRFSDEGSHATMNFSNLSQQQRLQKQQQQQQLNNRHQLSQSNLILAQPLQLFSETGNISPMNTMSFASYYSHHASLKSLLLDRFPPDNNLPDRQKDHSGLISPRSLPFTTSTGNISSVSKRFSDHELRDSTANRESRLSDFSTTVLEQNRGSSPSRSAYFDNRGFDMEVRSGERRYGRLSPRADVKESPDDSNIGDSNTGKSTSQAGVQPTESPTGPGNEQTKANKFFYNDHSPVEQQGITVDLQTNSIRGNRGHLNDQAENENFGQLRAANKGEASKNERDSLENNPDFIRYKDHFVNGVEYAEIEKREKKECNEGSEVDVARCMSALADQSAWLDKQEKELEMWRKQFQLRPHLHQENDPEHKIESTAENTTIQLVPLPDHQSFGEASYSVLTKEVGTTKGTGRPTTSSVVKIKPTSNITRNAVDLKHENNLVTGKNKDYEINEREKTDNQSEINEIKTRIAPSVEDLSKAKTLPASKPVNLVIRSDDDAKANTLGNQSKAVIRKPRLPPPTVQHEKPHQIESLIPSPQKRVAETAEIKPRKYYGPEYMQKNSSTKLVLPGLAKGESEKDLKQVTVQLLNGNKLCVLCATHSTGKQLYDCVSSQLALTDLALFGIAYLRGGEYFFMDGAISLLKVAPVNWSSKVKAETQQAKPFVVYFRVKFFVNSIDFLSSAITRHLFYNQLRHDTTDDDRIHQFMSSTEGVLQLGALALQAEYGAAYERSSCAVLEQYLSSTALRTIGREVAARSLDARHRKIGGISSEDAELEFVKSCMKHKFYGIYFYKAFKSNTNHADPVLIGLCLDGVVIGVERGDGLAMTQRHTWQTIQKISYDRQRFSVKPKPLYSPLPSTVIKHNYYTDDKKKSRYLLQLSTEYHRFHVVTKMVAPTAVQDNSAVKTTRQQLEPSLSAALDAFKHRLSEDKRKDGYKEQEDEDDLISDEEGADYSDDNDGYHRLQVLDDEVAVHDRPISSYLISDDVNSINYRPANTIKPQISAAQNKSKVMQLPETFHVETHEFDHHKENHRNKNDTNFETHDFSRRRVDVTFNDTIYDRTSIYSVDLDFDESVSSVDPNQAHAMIRNFGRPDSNQQSVFNKRKTDDETDTKRLAETKSNGMDYLVGSKVEPGRCTDDAQQFEVEIHKLDNSLGLNIAGGVDSPVKGGGIYVKSLTPGGAAEKLRRIEVGDQLLLVNGISLTRVTHGQAVEMLRQTPLISRLVIKRPNMLDSQISKQHLASPRISVSSADYSDFFTTNVDKMHTSANDGKNEQEFDHCRNEEQMKAKYDNREMLTVKLHKTSTDVGYGFGIAEGQTATRDNAGLFVARLVAGGVAARDGQLKKGDEILEINGRSVVGLSQAEAVELIKTVEGQVVVKFLSRACRSSCADSDHSSYNDSSEESYPSVFQYCNNSPPRTTAANKVLGLHQVDNPQAQGNLKQSDVVSGMAVTNKAFQASATFKSFNQDVV